MNHSKAIKYGGMHHAKHSALQRRTPPAAAGRRPVQRIGALRTTAAGAAVAVAEQAAALEMWTTGDPFAHDGFSDDGNRTFPPEDQRPVGGDASSVDDASRPAVTGSERKNLHPKAALNRGHTMPIPQSDQTGLVKLVEFRPTATDRWNLGAGVVFLFILALGTLIHLVLRAAGSW